MEQLTQNLIGNALKFRKNSINPHLIIMSFIERKDTNYRSKFSAELNYCLIIVNDNETNIYYKNI